MLLAIATVYRHDGGVNVIRLACGNCRQNIEAAAKMVVGELPLGIAAGICYAVRL